MITVTNRQSLGLSNSGSVTTIAVFMESEAIACAAPDLSGASTAQGCH